MTTAAANGSSLETLLEASWPGRGRAIRGRELRIELGATVVFLGAAVGLAITCDTSSGVHPAVIGVVLAYALAARVEFPIGAASLTPTELLLVPLFVIAAAPLVPLLVFAAFALAAAGAAANGRLGYDRLVFSAGDAAHALGPALVFSVFAHGDATTAGVAVIAAAFAAQFAADLVSSSLHELISMGARPRVHAGMVARVWMIDLALGTVGLLAAYLAVRHPWGALAPLPVVLLLRSMAIDRVRTIDAAHERLVAFEQERGRRLAAGELLERQKQFLQDVSHELRTPVTIARGHIDTLRRTQGPTPESEVALDELQRIERIIERQLVLTRAEHPDISRQRAINVESLLEDRFVRWSDTIPRAWQLGDLATGTVDGDDDALCAALDALIENAVKHTTTTQSITLSSRAQDGVLTIELADTGSGIPAAALDRIFERFGRADSARNREVGGVGLGLAFVDAVAKAHGGRCSVSSSQAGSTFTITLAGFRAAPRGS